jgi:hypothetical protein
MREIGKWAAEVAELLSRVEVSDDQVRKTMARVNALWGEIHGYRSHHFQERNELVALIAELGTALRCGTRDEHGVAEAFARGVVMRWPEHGHFRMEPVVVAVRAWAADERGRSASASGREKWGAVTHVLKEMGVIPKGMDRDTVREEFYRWLRRQPPKMRALLGIKTRPRA